MRYAGLDCEPPSCPCPNTHQGNTSVRCHNQFETRLDLTCSVSCDEKSCVPLEAVEAVEAVEGIPYQQARDAFALPVDDDGTYRQ